MRFEASDRLGVTVATSDPATMERLLVGLGFERTHGPSVEDVTAPGTGDPARRYARGPDGFVRVRPAPPPRRPRDPVACGSLGIGWYARDAGVVDTVAAVTGRGASAVVGAGPGAVRETALSLPDGLRGVLQVAGRRMASRLDDDGVASEVHTSVWVVDDVAAAVEGWAATGLTPVVHTSVEDDDVARVLGLPGTEPVEFAILAPPDRRPTRLELVTFPSARPTGTPGSDELVAGEHRLAVESPRPPEDAVAIDRAVDPDGPAWVLDGPGGVEVEWHQLG